MCEFKSNSVYTYIFLIPFYSRTSYAWLNATAVVYIKISSLLLSWSFKWAVDTKMITNSILPQMLLNFIQEYLAILFVSGFTFREIHFCDKYRLFYLKYFLGTSSTLTQNQICASHQVSDNFFLLFWSRTDKTPIQTSCKVTALKKTPSSLFNSNLLCICCRIGWHLLLKQKITRRA